MKSQLHCAADVNPNPFKTGKRSKEGVPHTEWECFDYWEIEKGEPSEICEWCGTQEIRHVHYMRHPIYDGKLRVGCDCAQDIEKDLKAGSRREQMYATWIKSPRWKKSGKGNPKLTQDGFIVVLSNNNGWWTIWARDVKTYSEEYFAERYETLNRAKTGALKALRYMKEKRLSARSIDVREFLMLEFFTRMHVERWIANSVKREQGNHHLNIIDVQVRLCVDTRLDISRGQLIGAMAISGFDLRLYDGGTGFRAAWRQDG